MRYRRVGDWTLEDELQQDHEPRVVLFVRSGSKACAWARRELMDLAADYFNARFLEVDLTENPSLAARFLIEETPTTLLFRDGIEVSRRTGHSLRPLLLKALGPEPDPNAD